MKTFKYLSMAAIAATTLTFASCSDDDDNKSNSDKPSIDDIIEDGFYISGDALPFTGVDVKGRMSLTPNEEGGESRDGLIDIYMTLEANKDFYFTEVKGASKKNFGGQGDVKVNQVDIADHYNGVILTGNYVEGESLNVEKSGLYHIAIDQQTQRFVVVPVTHWSIIGGSNEAGRNNND